MPASKFTKEDARREALGQAVAASVGQDYPPKEIVRTAEEFFQFLVREEEKARPDEAG